MRKLISLLSAVIFTVVSFTGISNAADSKKPIIIPTHNWTSQIVMAHVIGGMFESMGNNVEYVPADPQAVYEAIRIGDVTISHEVWQSTFGASFQAAIDKGGLLDWGKHEAPTLEEMGVPQWVVDKKLCPGLPNWEALKSADCAKNFATADSGGKGRWLEGPQSWHGTLMQDRVDALGLGDLWTVKYAGGSAALWAELVTAKKEGRGTVIFNWTPNFTDADGFVFIEFPPHKAGCRIADGGDGKCGSPKGWLKKAINADFVKTHPDAASAFKKLSFTAAHIGQMASLVDIDGMTTEDAGKKWLADNKSLWEKWTK